ncbi:hypothetical protein AYI69_g7639 [Smittium culicis]|uniref:Uncharacterized protein n=1 Tax=Smittium culicis TaxID=133412 RepID=A0A1R1XQR9_9FUNG|nr:hypothetical protein AYI69_g7639 [Smittium culicis]
MRLLPVLAARRAIEQRPANTSKTWHWSYWELLVTSITVYLHYSDQGQLALDNNGYINSICLEIIELFGGNRPANPLRLIINKNPINGRIC